MKNEAKRHHYIPQFILRNFRVNTNNDVCYFNIKTGQETIINTRDIFKVDDLYRDSINYPKLPTQIEQDLSRYESEIALLINNKFLNENIIINKNEDESLKLFFSIMSFRSIHTFEKFGEFMDDNNKDFYRLWQDNNDFNDFWKRNLGQLVKCRTFDDIIKNKNIDNPIKVFMHRDMFSLFGTSFIICECTGKDNFVIGDVYPVHIISETRKHMYSLIPISPRRIILLISNGVNYAHQNEFAFNKKIISYPTIDENNICFTVQKICNSDVIRINELMINTFKYGYIKYDRKSLKKGRIS